MNAQKVTLSIELVNAVLQYIGGSYSKTLTNSEANQLAAEITREARESLQPQTAPTNEVEAKKSK